MQHEESNLQNSIPTPDFDDSDDSEPDTPVFQVVEGASTRGKDLLVESNHYSYVRDGKPNKKQQQRWRCVVRNMQTGETFVRGAQPHKCSSKDCALPTAFIKSRLRKEGKARPFTSGATLVKEALQEYRSASVPASTLPSMAALVRSTNFLQQTNRATHPKKLDFNIVHDAILSGFLQKDITVGTSRHLLFFTAFLSSLLQKSKTWYADATFKAVQHPFRQLWSIHAFIRQNTSMKQVPLFFAVISRKSKDDYIAIFSYLRDLLPSTNVTTVVMDFESAVWGAFKTVFPSVITRGCSFHWTQAIYRHIQDLKLVQAYQERKNTSKYLRELMCLPFLPAEEIPATFKQFRDLLQPSHPQPLHRLVQYIEDQWIDSSIHPPSSWSIFGFSIRTNNDTEGWHHYLNQLCARTNNQAVMQPVQTD